MKTLSYILLLTLSGFTGMAQTWPTDTIEVYGRREIAIPFAYHGEIGTLTENMSFAVRTVSIREFVTPFQSWTWHRIQVDQFQVHPVSLQLLITEQENRPYEIYAIFRHGESGKNLTYEFTSGLYPQLEEWFMEWANTTDGLVRR